jgi:hypothetical protein
MLPCTIDTEEERDMATAGIPDAFMQTDMEDTEHMIMYVRRKNGRAARKNRPKTLPKVFTYKLQG